MASKFLGRKGCNPNSHEGLTHQHYQVHLKGRKVRDCKSAAARTASSSSYNYNVDKDSSGVGYKVRVLRYPDGYERVLRYPIDYKRSGKERTAQAQASSTFADQPPHNASWDITGAEALEKPPAVETKQQPLAGKSKASVPVEESTEEKGRKRVETVSRKERNSICNSPVVMESWGFGSSLDIKSFSQKLNDTARKIKDDVEKTVDEALGIEAKAKKEGEEGEEINYWQSDDADDGEEGGWDIDQELDIGDGASEEKGAEEVEESKEKEGTPPVKLESSRLEPPSPAQEQEMKKKDSVKREEKSEAEAKLLAKLKKKETEVQEILEEGEKLSKRQHESEQTIKKLRAKVKELKGEQKKAADKGLANVDEVHKQIVSLEKENKDLKASSEMIELQLQSYQKRVQELQELLSETESKGLENVEKLRKDLQESSARLRETEMQYAEIAVNVPEATKPLVEQIDQLQQELASKEDTWSSVENSLSLKLRDLESKIRQYEKAGVTQQQLLKDGADKIKELLQEKDELQDRLAEVEKSFQSVSGQKEVTEESLSPVQVDDKSAELQVKLMEEKWKRESVEIELEKQKDEFEKRVRKEVEKVKHAMKVQQQGDKNIEYNGKVADTVADFDPISEISTPQKLIQASSTTNISELEVVCNKLAEELVAKTRLLSASQKRLKDLEMDGDYLSLKTKHTMSLELVGEKEEEIEHLNNDLSDLKRLYQEHITDVLERLNQQEQT